MTRKCQCTHAVDRTESCMSIKYKVWKSHLVLVSCWPFASVAVVQQPTNNGNNNKHQNQTATHDPQPSTSTPIARTTLHTQPAHLSASVVCVNSPIGTIADRSTRAALVAASRSLRTKSDRLRRLLAYVPRAVHDDQPELQSIISLLSTGLR